MQRALSLGLVALLVVISFSRNALWSDEGLLWSDTIGKSPRKSRAFNELGLHLLATGEHQTAYRLLVRSLELNPYQAEVVINLGLALERLGKVPDAIKAYERATWLTPSEPTAFYNLGVIHYNVLKDRDKALGYFLRARDLDPREPDVHAFLSRIYAEKGDHAQAREELSLYQRLKH